MQLVHPAETITVDFYPAAGLPNKFVKVVTFSGGQESESLITKRDMEREVDSRIYGYGYSVTKFHTSPRVKFMVCC